MRSRHLRMGVVRLGFRRSLRRADRADRRPTLALSRWEYNDVINGQLAAAQARRAERLTRRPRVRLAGERASWAELVRRVFDVDGYRCPGCGGRLALRTRVVNPPATTKILRGLQHAQGPP